MEEYSNGLIKATDCIIGYVDSKIRKIKTSAPEINNPRQITTNGKLLAYHDVRSKARAQREKYEKIKMKQKTTTPQLDQTVVQQSMDVMAKMMATQFADWIGEKDVIRYKQGTWNRHISFDEDLTTSELYNLFIQSIKTKK